MMKTLLFFLFSFSFVTLGQETKPVMVPELKIGMHETLDKVLQKIASQVSEAEVPVTVKYASEGLGDRRLPKLQLRRVPAKTLFTLLGRLSKTEVTLLEGEILVQALKKDGELNGAENEAKRLKREEAIAEILRLRELAESTNLRAELSKVLPLQGSEMTKEVYDLSDVLSRSEMNFSGVEKIASGLEVKLTLHAGFRRDALDQKPFSVEHNAASRVIILKAPVAYHLTAQNYFAELRQAVGIVPEKSESDGQVSAEPAVAVSEEAVSSGGDVDETLASLERAALLRALREMNRKLGLLEKRAQLQEEKIDELSRLLYKKNEAEKSE